MGIFRPEPPRNSHTLGRDKADSIQKPKSSNRHLHYLTTTVQLYTMFLLFLVFPSSLSIALSPFLLIVLVPITYQLLFFLIYFRLIIISK